jgi:hypothetical protein
MRIRSLAFACVLFMTAPAAAEDTLSVVLQRAGAYAMRAREQLSGIVAEETYVQNVRRALGVEVTLDGKGTMPANHRTMKSDILMVRADDRYVEFRDVFDVDGRPVRDRQDRLTRLFLAPKLSVDQLRRISAESARYNIGSVFRNFNTPALALVFLEPEQQARSRFRRVDDARPALSRGWPEKVAEPFAAPPSAWVIEFQETRKGTLIRRRIGNGDLPSRGRFWIDPATGTVLLTELLVGDPMSRCTISVRYAPSLPGTDMLVPAEMRERYVNRSDHVTTTGSAFYSRHRRFGVQTQEVIPTPAAQDPGNHPAPAADVERGARLEGSRFDRRSGQPAAPAAMA